MAKFHILNAGYRSDGVASTVSLIEADDHLVVVDPGMVRTTSVILDPLEELGYHPEQVTDVVISHHHPDHTINIALFSNANVHDHWAIYHRDVWTPRSAEGFMVADGVTLWETPGHTPQDITTLVDTDDDIVALTHLWWDDEGPADDPFATDSAALHDGRARVLDKATLIVPGHGVPFLPTNSTPR